MPLIPTFLAQSLQADWLPGDKDGPWHDDVQASADAFAGAVAGWFGGALAAGFPCATASARKSQLMGQMIPALQVKDAMGAGQQEALAFMAYVAGQSFGPGVAAPPIATAAAGALIGAAFAALVQPQSARAGSIASALHLMAVSTIVALPIPPFAAPVT